MTAHSVFLSYCQEDLDRANALERSLKDRGLQVWLDKQSISAGASWFESIEENIPISRGVVVLISASSTSSNWVLYEYAFARGAGIPIIAVTTPGVSIPDPLKRFQIVDYTDPDVAGKIDDGLKEQSRIAGQKRAFSAPTLMAKFREVNGEPVPASKGKTPELWIEMWLEQVPKETEKVAFEIQDEAFKPNEWTMKRASPGAMAAREFLCDDMRSYGDVDIWARGIGEGAGNWSGSWRLYEALALYYRSRPASAGIHEALKQIELN
jgi:hypothetical protein